MAWGAPGNTAVKIGLHVPNFGAFADPGTVAERRDAGATWWLRVLPWSRPIEESARTVESGPPGR
jgi:hypothetical protein